MVWNDDIWRTKDPESFEKHKRLRRVLYGYGGSLPEAKHEETI
jgi:hypothetical protein